MCSRIAKTAWPFIGTVAALHVAYYFPRCVDDLFISLRIAENLAGGHGVVFNPGERVEGYSSPFWMALQAIGFVVGFEGVTWTKLLGAGALAALLVGSERLAREYLGTRPLPALVAPAFVTLDSHVVAWSVLGLETPAFLALLVWFPIVLRRYLEDGGRRSAGIAGAVTVALACVRPEAPLYIAAIALAELITKSPRPLRLRVASGARLAAPVLAILGALLLARHAYFGLWFPHTYYVKGATSGWELAKLRPLVTDGVGPAERLFYLIGTALAGILALTRRGPALLVGLGCALFFTASMERDWMPSLRHLLPLPVLLAVAWAWAIDRVSRSTALPGSMPRSAALVVAGFVLVCGGHLAAVDVRLSPADKRDRKWVVPKTKASLRDSWMELRGLEPPDVAAFGSYQMGLVTQNYRVLEAAAASVDDSWFVGRDIGQVGFYTGVRVFDTPGLITPAVVQSAAWRRDRGVDGALVSEAFARKPVAAELLDAWPAAVASRPDLLAGYDVAEGTVSSPNDLMQSDRPLPSSEEVLRRYERSLAKFPSWFSLATLYGESSGAAMRKRVRRVREIVAAEQEPLRTTPLGREQGAGARLDEAVESLGCEVTPATVRAGDSVKVSCSWRAVGTPTRVYWAFLHFDDELGTVAFQDDHPVGAFRPTNQWHPGDVVHDGARMTVPRGARPGSYRLHFGFWKGEQRPRVTPADMSDGKDRIKGSTLQVIP